MEQAPFSDEAAEAGVERETFHFVGGEPTEGVAFLAEDGCGGIARDEDVAKVVVPVGGLGAVGGDLVEVEIEGTGGGEDQAFEPGFFARFTRGDGGDIRVAIAMAAELQPAVELPVMVEERAGAIGADHEGTPREVGGEAGAEEAVRRGIEEGEHAVAGRLFVGPFGEIEGGELLAEFGSGHGGGDYAKVGSEAR